MSRRRRSGSGPSGADPRAAPEQRAIALLRQGRHDEAEPLLRQLIAAGSGSAATYGNLAALCGLKGETAEMITLLRRALALRPDYPEALSNLGIALQEQGQLEEAISAYHQALQCRPAYPEALTNLASALQERGDLDAAIRTYRQALAGDAAHPQAWIGLSQALRQSGDLAEATRACREALSLRPDHAGTHVTLAQLLRQQGEDEAAIHHYRQALAQQPEDPEALVNMGHALRDRKDRDAALAAFQRALELRPDFPEALSSLGITLQENGDSEAAIAAYRRAIALDPDFAPGHSNLGISLTETGALEPAIAAFREAIRLEPDFAEAYSNLGVALQEQGALEEAIAAYGQALVLQPEYPEACCNLGNALQEMADVEGSIASYRRAIALKPDYPDAQKNLAMAILLRGDYSDGWKRYEWRFHSEPGLKLLNALPAGPPSDQALPDPGGSLLLVSEQGYGDTLQFIRYVLPLRQRGLTVRLCAPPKLHGLIQASGLDPAPLDPEQVHGQPHGPWLPLLSVPGLLGVSEAQPLVSAPYLQPGEALRRKWHEILAAEQRPIIAINWQGNPEHEKSTSKGRSLPLEAFAPLAQLPGISLLSLQKGHGSEQLEGCSFRSRFVGCQPLVSDTWDFEETVAIIANCDLVITSDTAVAHLAAGSSAPTWLLLKQVAEWRWGLAGERSGWYPSMRLFRQERRGDWSGVLERVAAELDRRLGRTAAPELPVPPEAVDLYNRALALQQRGELQEAIAAYRRALDLQPAFPEALGNLGVALQAQGDGQGAIAALNQAVTLRPDFAEAFSNLGNALHEQGNMTEAIAALERAVALRPDYAEAYSNLATSYKERKQLDRALAACQRALCLRPEYPEALSNLGNILQAQATQHGPDQAPPVLLDDGAAQPAVLRDLAEIQRRHGSRQAAIAAYRLALAQKPAYANAHYNLAIALKDLGHPHDAVAAYRRAIAIRPDYVEALSNLGNTLQELGAVEEAIAAYQTALSHNPGHAAAQKNLAMAWLMQGNYRQGWPQYEWRLREEGGERLLFARPSIPRWDGSPLPPGERLVLVGEQGLGDILQFMRYVLPLRQRGIAVSLCALAKLHGLIRDSGIDPAPLTPAEAERLEQGRWLPLLSLPGLLEASAAEPLVSEPYIRPSAERVAAWRTILAGEQRPIIAINWQGNPEHETTNSRGRSLPLEALAPLAELPGLSLLSLQKGHGSEQLPGCSFRNRFVRCQDRVDAAWDFQETAAIIANCDLVISSDTAVAHLAAGMGAPTWLLLKDVPEWRWGLEGERSGWYPSMRLFRQRQRGNWAEVVQRLAIALQLHLEQAAAAADPAAALTRLANACKRQGRIEEAISAYRQALAVGGEQPDTLCNLGNSHLLQGDPEAAVACFQRGLAVDPRHVLLHHNLGIARQELGDVAAAIACFEQALQADPGFAEAHGALAMALLLAGDYRRGWQAYEWRFETEHRLNLLNARPPLRRWQGGELGEGEPLILVSEQGLGDTLQFIRYGQTLQSRGVPFHFCAPAKLHGLIRESGLDPEPLTPEQAEQLTVGQWLPLLSLPGLLGVTAEQPLVVAPYLRSPPERIAHWRRQLAGDAGPIVAINWQGNPDHEQTTSRGRSLPLEALAPLAAVPGLRLLSLQKGPGSEQLAACSFRDRFVACQEQVSDTWDFLETAAIIASCDLVISSDTAVAHLAAAMGAPTWLLLKDVPEWRWGLTGERSAWYPSMRLFRQERRGDWSGAVAAVVRAIGQELPAGQLP